MVIRKRVTTLMISPRTLYECCVSTTLHRPSMCCVLSGVCNSAAPYNDSVLFNRSVFVYPTLAILSPVFYYRCRVNFSINEKLSGGSEIVSLLKGV